MSKVLESSNYEQLCSLDEKLLYVKQLSKEAEFEKALHHYFLLYDEAKGQSEYGILMDCLSGICQNLGNLGRIAEIEPYLQEYRHYCEMYGDDLAKLKLNSLIGYLSGSIEDYETTVHHYEIALAIASKLEDIQRTIFLLINLQGVYLNVNEMDKALNCSYHLKRLVKEDRSAFTSLSHCAYLLNYMTILIERNELENIPNLMLELEQVKGFEKLKREQMYGAFIKGRYYEQKNIPSKAIEQYEKSYTFLEETKETPYYSKVLKHLILNYKKLCQFEKAVYYSDLLILHLESVERQKLKFKTIELSRKLKFDEMQSLIYVDSLTNIHNRRYLDIQGEKWVEQARENNQSIACAIIDIDNFKMINDTYGHVFGDEVIQQFAHTLSNHMELDMLCARYGGDEFIILARYKDDYQALFNRLYDQLCKLTVQKNEMGTTVEISVGVSIISNCSKMKLCDVIEGADQALYQSKESGKNILTFNIQ